MIRSLFVFFLVPVLGLALIVACGGDEEAGLPLARDEYFRELQERFDSWAEAYLELAFEFPDSLSEEERVSAGFDFYHQQVDLTQDLARKLDAMTPPPSLMDLHLDLASTADDSADTFAAWVDWVRLTDPEERESVGSAPNSVDLKEAGDRFEMACLAVEDASAEAFSCFSLERACLAIEDESADAFSCDGGGTRGGVFCFGGIGGLGDDPQPAEVVECSSELLDIDLPFGIGGERSDPPSIPTELEPMSEYLEFGGSSSGTTTIGFPLLKPVKDTAGLGWYTYREGVWTLLDVPVRLALDGSVAEGEFEVVPPNLIVLRER